MKDLSQIDLSSVIEDFQAAFRLLNSHLFNGTLKEPTFTIGFEGKRISVVHNTNGCNFALGFSLLSLPLDAIAVELIHEMIHLYNKGACQKDSSRGGAYHNKIFKQEAERRGMVVANTSKAGWEIVGVDTEMQKWISTNITIQPSASVIAFIVENQTDGHKHKSGSIKYCCPSCKNIVRATKQIHVICGDCMQMMTNDIHSVYRNKEIPFTDLFFQLTGERI